MNQKNKAQQNAYPEFDGLNLSAIDELILKYWKENKTFEKSVSERSEEKPFIFYEGPPSANGMPGIHHVMARTVKDIFCRYKTMQGFRVERKGGWDTHGLPVELKVEQELGITKEDIGKKISVDEYNAKCKETVMQFKDVWDDLTVKMGYWVDLENPYITFDNKYIESVWWILRQLFEKGLMYKGYTIQPYSPAAGTGLSSHELNQPGCYKDVTDTSAVAQFRAIKNEKSAFLFDTDDEDVCFIAWTTTPWTLPSNTALCVGKKIEYVKVKTSNPYTNKPVSIILAKDLLEKWNLSEENVSINISGKELAGIHYEQLLPYFQPETGDAFIVITGDFVTTSDGTGIVHIAPSFGTDDKKVAEENGIGSLTLVDLQGKFVEGVGEFSGRYVKDYMNEENYRSVDIDISIKLKEENKAFNVQKYKHNYPHCWRTDKPIIYYPLDSWFIQTTAVKDKMIANNNLINWKPKSTGEGRFGKWLEDLKDWNLSRSRYWGIPLPIWRTQDNEEQICIGSVEQLNEEMQKANEVLGLNNQPLADLHRPYVDDIVLVSPSGKPMKRELDVIDVWFDSGSMPYAQDHYPFSTNKLPNNGVADFIAEGVDQTRGWFFTLHAIATMLFDQPAYKNVIANGLVLDKNGQKMSKRLGNAVDPFDTLTKYGADATRWYMIANAPPWDNLKFDTLGIEEVRRKFFGTLYNTYSFFALYANLDNFNYSEEEVPLENRQEIDRWILSVLNTLIIEVKNAFEDYDPTRAARLIQTFLDDNLSNWYVRLNRRRFWKGDYSEDKVVAYQTLYKCVETISILSAPIAPFFADFLFQNLNKITKKHQEESVHLVLYPEVNNQAIDAALEERMAIAQTISSLVLSLRKNEKIKVRQPLSKILIPILSEEEKLKIEKVESYILNEINVKAIEYLFDTSGFIKKKIKPNFKTLGPKYGQIMKAIAAHVNTFTQDDIKNIEQNKFLNITIDDQEVQLSIEDVEISTDDIPGWLVASENGTTIALDIKITDELKAEGDAREFINKIQNIRKDSNFEVTDKIIVNIKEEQKFKPALVQFKDYICTEILATNLIEVTVLEKFEEIEINEFNLFVNIEKN